MPELEKTVGLMKKVVERVQRENETLKNPSRSVGHAKVASLQQENLRLKVEHVPQMPTALPPSTLRRELFAFSPRTRMKTSGAGAKPS